jgi:SAM-dependent methyltransferase
MSEEKEQESITIEHYETQAQSFWDGTKDHDVSQNTRAFLDALPSDKPLDILDLGCGPGRDLHYFKSLGHRPVGLDGSASFCKMASLYSGCPTINKTFTSMGLGQHQFDGVFANASLFHVPSVELLGVLKDIHASLRADGILFMSNPRGQAEGWNGKRYGFYQELASSQKFLEQAGFKILHHYYRPERKPRELQPWLAIVSRRLV